MCLPTMLVLAVVVVARSRLLLYSQQGCWRQHAVVGGCRTLLHATRVVYTVPLQWVHCSCARVKRKHVCRCHSVNRGTPVVCASAEISLCYVEQVGFEPGVKEWRRDWWQNCEKTHVKCGDWELWSSLDRMRLPKRVGKWISKRGSVLMDMIRDFWGTYWR